MSHRLKSSRFSPRSLPYEALERLTVGRDELLKQCFDNVSAAVIAGQARHPGGDLVTVKVASLQNFADQFADLSGVVALTRYSEGRLRNIEDVQRSIVFAAGHVQAPAPALRCAWSAYLVFSSAPGICLTYACKVSERFGRCRFGFSSSSQRSGHSTSGLRSSTAAMARSTRG